MTAAGSNLASIDDVETALAKHRSRATLVKGWFHETLPEWRDKTGPIALLHIDCDWYTSIKTCLEQLYAQVVPGGYVVVDDYYRWLGCRQAVDEFLPDASLTAVDGNAVFWMKS